jgi:hypothetical protein
MIRIQLETHSTVCTIIGQLFDNLTSSFHDQLQSDSVVDDHEPPFVELSYSEIPDSELEPILGYSGILNANCPIGVDCDGSPELVGVSPEKKFLLFPIRELEAEIRRNASDIATRYDQLGGMNGLCDELGDDMSAREYLVGGLLDCIKYCKERKFALVIRW